MLAGSTTTDQAERSRIGLILGLGLLALFAYAVLRNAWMSDDAYISLRTVHNFVEGHGLRWNTADRVQTYTHPLWLLLMSGAVATTSEVFATIIWLSVGVSLLAAALLVRSVPRSTGATVCALLALTLSRPYVEFSTSGLENPLSHLCVAAFAVVWFGSAAVERRFTLLGLIAGAAACNRMDLCVLFTPALLCAAWPLRWRRAIRCALPGAAVFGGWLAFAAFYYGTPFPVTAYAKAFCHGVPRPELWAQSASYFADLWATDPMTAIVIAAGILASVCQPGRLMPLAAGVVAYLGYIVHIGGDFMSGRMFTTPFVLATVVAAHCPLLGRQRIATVAAVLIAGLGMLGSTPTLWAPVAPPRQTLDADGISNERTFYLLELGYWNVGTGDGLRAPPAVNADQLRAVLKQPPVVVVRAGVGLPGFAGGDYSHVVDHWLCDPLMARLPIENPNEWRIGHFRRRIPEGYLETLATGTNRIRHAELASYYDTLALATRGDLWSTARLGAAWRLLSGGAQSDLQSFLDTDYYDPPTPVLRAADVARPLAPGTPWHDEAAHVVYAGGIEVRFAEPQRAARLELTLDGGDPYEIGFGLGERVVATASVRTKLPLLGLEQVALDVPEAARTGFDRVTLRIGDPEGSLDGIWALGHLRIPD